MKKSTDFKKLVLGSAGKKRVKEGNWSLFGLGGNDRYGKYAKKGYVWQTHDGNRKYMEREAKSWRAKGHGTYIKRADDEEYVLFRTKNRTH